MCTFIRIRSCYRRDTARNNEIRPLDGIQGKLFAISNNTGFIFYSLLFLILNLGDRIVIEYETGNKINPIIVDKTKPRDWFRGALFSQMVPGREMNWLYKILI